MISCMYKSFIAADPELAPKYLSCAEIRPFFRESWDVMDRVSGKHVNSSMTYANNTNYGYAGLISEPMEPQSDSG